MTEINDPLLDLLNETPKRSATLATYHGAYLWRHHRFTLPPRTSPVVAHLADLIIRKINDRRDRVEGIRNALRTTRAACDEMIACLDANDELRETMRSAYDPNDFIHDLRRTDAAIAELVQLLKSVSACSQCGPGHADEDGNCTRHGKPILR